VIPLVQQQLDAIGAACRRHGVARLDLFGSAGRAANFDPATSDVDFIVSFRPDADLGPWLAEYFDLRDEIQRVLQRPVDLVMEAAMSNALFRREAERTRQLVYAAQDTETAR
jgi:uncharacterized protein